MRSLPLGAAIVVLRLVWWMPTITLRLARLAGLRVWHLAEMIVVEVLFALRRDRAARRVLAGTIRRNRRQLRTERRRARER